jgi:hypothetical protein
MSREELTYIGGWSIIRLSCPILAATDRSADPEVTETQFAGQTIDFRLCVPLSNLHPGHRVSSRGPHTPDGAVRHQRMSAPPRVGGSGYLED